MPSEIPPAKLEHVCAALFRLRPEASVGQTARTALCAAAEWDAANPCPDEEFRRGLEAGYSAALAAPPLEE